MPQTKDEKPARKPHASWTRRKEARPDEILQAAVRLFGEHGYKACRMEDIAKEAGLTKGALYLYYSNKEALLKAVISTLLLPVVQSLGCYAKEPAGSARELLHEMLVLWFKTVENTPGLINVPKLVLAEAHHFPEIAAQYHEEVILRVRELLSGILRYGRERGEFSGDFDPDVRAEMMIAPLVLKMLRHHVFSSMEKRQLSPQEYMAAYLDCFLNGLDKSC